MGIRGKRQKGGKGRKRWKSIKNGRKGRVKKRERGMASELGEGCLLVLRGIGDVRPWLRRSLFRYAEPLVFLRATACYASCVLAIVEVSICLSVRPAVCQTLEPCQNGARITKSPLWAAARSLVFSGKISCPWVRGFPSNKGVK